MKIQERAGAGNHRSSAPAQPAMGERLPSAPRERKPALAALAVLLILVGALGATMLVLQAGDRIEVVKITQDIPQGGSVNSGNSAHVMVAEDSGIHYVKWSQRGKLAKLKAESAIPAGALAVGEMFTADEGLSDDEASVGLSLKEGQYPAQLKDGDIVAAYRVGSDAGSNDKDDDAGAPSGSTPLVAQARVDSLRKKEDGQISSGNQTLNLIVGTDEAAALASAASAGEVALVRVPGKN
ncbi:MULTISPECIES: hypothetical protein [Streptomyces]|uniref:SAF domain-containing protein n=1 Tax=Streptomyces albus (strain ATCC 21838 / DSM 41398 / FERM P-419 / JCM 4703 / NBRC 107858) TaxID=1081613 RepID=A0A0B5EL43_STRA4|nr:hypothetical protein [Streptomyces sp. SCSIO ZS0520]AJE83083.1 hypothetical protein SLNWT_2707 [Streptomyces albus]AOU77393.1 hypothetical protein SLNHY_2702 [Streptomyces albus]